MSQVIFVPELNQEFEFPDEATDAQIKSFLRRQTPVQQTEAKLSPKQQEIISFLQEREARPTAKALRALTGLRPKSEQLLETFESETPIRTSVKQTVENVAKIAPMLAAPAVRGGIIGKKAITELIKSSARVGGLIGAAKATEEVAEGKPIEEAAKEATFSALTGSILGAGTKITTNTIKAASKGLLGRLSQVRNNAVQQAIKNPELITTEQKTVTEVGKEIVETIDDFARAQSEKFEKGISKIKAPKGNIIDTKPARDALIEKGVSTEQLKKQILSVARSEASDISENTIDRFLGGGNLSFDESRQVNSLLRQVGGSRLEAIGSGLKGKVSSAKKILLDEMESKVPGIRRVNKLFAKSAEKVKKLQSTFGKTVDEAERKEGVLRAVGEQLTGIRRNRGAAIRELKGLDRRMKTDFTKDLKGSVVSEAFENLSMDNLMGTLRTGGGAGIGATLGAAAGIPGAGAVLGAAASQVLTTPQATRAGILAGRAISPVITGVERAAPVSLNRIMFGESGER